MRRSIDLKIVVLSFLIMLVLVVSCSDMEKPNRIFLRLIRTPMLKVALGPALVPTAQHLVSIVDTLPTVLSRIDPMPGTSEAFSGCVYVEIAQSEAWAVGDSPETIIERLMKHSLFSIDGDVVSLNGLPFFSSGPLHRRYDPDGNYEGSYGGHVATCIPANLTTGIHMVEFHIPLGSSRVIVYKWAFYVK